MRGFPLRLLTVVAAGLLPFLLAGCAEVLGDVSGEVKLGDKPLANGTVTFQSMTRKKKSYPATVKDGKYSIVGIPVGEVTITVQGSNSPPPPVPTGKGTPAPKALPKTKEKHLVVQSKYSDPKKSGLTYTVVQGEQTHNFTVEGDVLK